MADLVESAEDVQGGRIAVLDMGGTLVRNHYFGSSNSELNKSLGVPESQEKLSYIKHADDEGEISDHEAHAEHISIAIRGEETSLEDYIEAREFLMEDMKTLNGSDMFVDDLNDEGYTTVILSAAPPCVSIPYAEELGVDFVYKWKSFRFNEDGEFEKIEVNEEATKGKHQVIESLREDGAEVAYAGNGLNDVKATREADYGIIQSWDDDPENAYHNALETFANQETNFEREEDYEN